MNYKKYRPVASLEMPERNWPDKRISTAPIWCSVDLRDGNQSLPVSMSMDRKLKLFKLLCDIGFKEIEVAFPSSCESEYRFVRHLIENNLIPEDVTIQVITQTRSDLIKRTIDSLMGVKRAIINFYLPTSPVQRRMVFKKSRQEMIELAKRGAEFLKKQTRRLSGSEIRFLFAPESFSLTEPEFAVQICEEVVTVMEATVNNKIILNLPSSMEVSTPNIFADRVEWFIKNLKNRDAAIISIHTHNDRGTAVASTELALLAGAERVEGTLFGFGERAGNADILTLALNLLSEGIDPCLDLSDIRTTKATVEECTGYRVHERHPYAGELVFKTFAGSHQDAIKKTLRITERSPFWNIPYLIIDPSDIGRQDEEIIGINSQSGGSGISYVLKKYKNIVLHKDICSRIIKELKSIHLTESHEIAPEKICTIAERYISSNL
ncbi:MAG: 2-isopropylmalate synthase [Nitrospirae bacterium]|nr:2-isopropylmalate synthase [Nitrospirota bacterium]